MDSYGVVADTSSSRHGERGFTLAEVMVVVLIIGILLGIGIPTFLGARERSADRAAQTELRIAADTALVVSDFGADFTSASAGALASAEPSQAYVSGTTPPPVGVVSVDHTRPGEWSAVTRSGSGRCFGVLIVPTGRQTYESPSCRAAFAGSESPSSPGYVAPAPDPVLTGDATYVGAPADGVQFAPNQEYRSDDELFVFYESALVLDASLTVAGITIPAGTSVCSYIVWYDPSFTTSVSATIDFGDPILAGAGRRSDLMATDQFAVPGVEYYNYNRPWYDGDTFSSVGSVGQFDAQAVGNNADMIRILTDCG